MLSALAEIDLPFILTVFARDMEWFELLGICAVLGILFVCWAVKLSKGKDFGPSHTEAFPGD